MHAWRRAFLTGASLTPATPAFDADLSPCRIPHLSCRTCASRCKKNNPQPWSAYNEEELWVLFLRVIWVRTHHLVKTLNLTLNLFSSCRKWYKYNYLYYNITYNYIWSFTIKFWYLCWWGLVSWTTRELEEEEASNACTCSRLRARIGAAASGIAVPLDTCVRGIRLFYILYIYIYIYYRNASKNDK